MATESGLFINGKFTEGVGAQRLEVHSPSNGELVGAVPIATLPFFDAEICIRGGLMYCIDMRPTVTLLPVGCVCVHFYPKEQNDRKIVPPLLYSSDTSR